MLFKLNYYYSHQQAGHLVYCPSEWQLPPSTEEQGRNNHHNYNQNHIGKPSETCNIMTTFEHNIIWKRLCKTCIGFQILQTQLWWVCHTKMAILRPWEKSKTSKLPGLGISKVQMMSLICSSLNLKCQAPRIIRHGHHYDIWLTAHQNDSCLQVLLCFLLSSPRFDFHSRCFSIPHILSTTIISISLSLHLVLLVPVNSCSLHIILY